MPKTLFCGLKSKKKPSAPSAPRSSAPSARRCSAPSVPRFSQLRRSAFRLFFIYNSNPVYEQGCAVYAYTLQSKHMELSGLAHSTCINVVHMCLNREFFIQNRPLICALCRQYIANILYWGTFSTSFFLTWAEVPLRNDSLTHQLFQGSDMPTCKTDFWFTEWQQEVNWNLLCENPFLNNSAVTYLSYLFNWVDLFLTILHNIESLDSTTDCCTGTYLQSRGGTLEITCYCLLLLY